VAIYDRVPGSGEAAMPDTTTVFRCREELMTHIAANYRHLIALMALAIHVLSGTATAQLRLQTYVSGLTLPVGFVQDPSNASIQYVIEQRGLIRTIVNGTLLTTPFLNVSSLVSCCGEQGLLGLAFPPDYATSGRFYVNYTNAAGDTVVARYLRSASNPLLADPASQFPLRWGGVSTEIFQPFANHNGGHIAFNPQDGYLYIGMGDGGAANDPQNNAQNPASLLGKMLRIDVNVPLNHPNGYVIPRDSFYQPGNAAGVLPEIFAFGLRNPWKFSFDPSALGGVGGAFIGDVGQNNWEEIDYLSPYGIWFPQNFEWRNFEGSHPNPNPLVGGTLPLFPSSLGGRPVVEYPHPEGSSVTGGVVYRGPALGSPYRGRYFYGDLNGRIWSVGVFASELGVVAGSPIEHTAELGGTGLTALLTAIGTDAVGEMYLVNYSRGVVLKIVNPSIRPPAADFNGDRWPDLVWRNEVTGQLAAWNMRVRGFGVELLGGGLLTAPPLPAGWRVVGTGDADGDGQTDVFLQSDDGLLGVWFFVRSTYHRGAWLNPGVVSDPAWKVRAVADFNHDGHPDLVWQYTPTGQVAFWLMNGTNAVSYLFPSVAAPGPDWEIVGTGDSNFDGELDLYWQHRPTGRLAVWHMAGTDFRAGVFLSESPTDPGWRAVGVCDLDVDGSPDIVFQHAPTGTVAAWYLSGETLRGGSYLNPSNVGDSNWKLVGPR
jgi:hypothetical protein